MLETEYLKLKYHDNVESNTDEVDAEEYFNKNYKKIDANAKKNYEDLTKLKEDLQKENTELANNMPWNTVRGKNLHIADSAKYSKNRLEISGDMEQETTKGLQLYNDTDYFFKTSDVTIDNKHYITVTMNNTSGTSTVYKEFHTNLSSLIKPSTEYTFVIEIKSVNGNGILRINSTSNGKIESQFPASLSYNLNNLTAGQIIKYKATSISDFADFKRFLRSNVLFNAGESGSITFRISVLEGDKTSQAFEYEHFTGGQAKPNTNYPSIPVVCTGVQKIIICKKNILNTQKNASIASLGITATTNEERIITINGTTNNTAYIKLNDILKVVNYNAILTESKKFLNKGKYVISFKYISGEKSTNGMTLNLRNEMSNPDIAISSGHLNTNSISIKSELINDFKMFMYIWIASGTTFNNYKFAVQIENVDTLEENATSYEPYNGTEHTLNLGPTELCAIENVQDKCIIKNGKWCKQQNINKHKFAGSDVDSVNFYSDNTNTLAVNLLPNKVDCPAIKYNNVISMYCDKFKFINNIEDTEHIYVTGNMPIENGYKGNIRLYINKDRLSGYNSSLTNVQKANLVKTWLQANPITVYYIASSPTYIDCTTEQSNVLDKLYNNLELQKGTNNIIVESSNGVGINMELTYIQDNNLKDKKLEERITVLENLLSTTQTSALLLDNLQSDLESEVN